MTDKAVIVLGPPSMINEIPGTVSLVADCGHEAICAPATKAMYEENPEAFETTCMNCLDPVAVAKTLKELGGFGRVPGAREEFAAVFGEEEAERMDTEIPWIDEAEK